MLSNQLHINTDKCIYMHFKPHLNYKQRLTCARSRIVGSENQLFINNSKIKKTNCVRFLGVIIDENLNWDIHLEHLEQKLNSAIITIKRIKKFIPKEHYSKLYHTLFASHLTYGISAWGSCSKKKLNKIFSIQKRCIRLLFGKKYNFDHSDFYKTCARVRSIDEHIAPKNYELEHTKPLFTELKFLTVHNLHKLFVLNEIFKIKKYRYPISLHNFLHKTSESSRQCRKDKLVLPNYCLNFSRAQFFHNGITTWNQMINSINKYKCIEASIDFPADLSISFNVAKRKFKDILLKLQSNGNIFVWEKHNFIVNFFMYIS